MLGRIIEFYRYKDDDGLLTDLLSCSFELLEVKRVFSISNVAYNKSRGNHAAMNSKLLFIVLNGDVRITLSNGKTEEEYIVNANGLFVDSGIWIRADHFSSKDTILIVLSDMTYAECNYINDYSKYLEFVTVNE